MRGLITLISMLLHRCRVKEEEEGEKKGMPSKYEILHVCLPLPTPVIFQLYLSEYQRCRVAKQNTKFPCCTAER